MQQAQDFRDESAALYDLIKDLSDDELNAPTGFKQWTFNNIVGHLHAWNYAADSSLKMDGSFETYLGQVMGAMKKGASFSEAEADWRGDLNGRDLVKTWRDFFHTTADNFSQADPSARLPWAGPSMSARSSITARLMETWAHGQAMYDEMGVEREDADRIRNIVVLGVNTYGWTYKVRKQEPLGDMPYLELTAPSGEVWTYGDKGRGESIRGRATEFCQVVTQTRNIADTDLKVTGEAAKDWMSKAQCFAGGPEAPPAPGMRKRKTSASH